MKRHFLLVVTFCIVIKGFSQTFSLDSAFIFPPCDSGFVGTIFTPPAGANLFTTYSIEFQDVLTGNLPTIPGLPTFPGLPGGNTSNTIVIATNLIGIAIPDAQADQFGIGRGKSGLVNISGGQPGPPILPEGTPNGIYQARLISSTGDTTAWFVGNPVPLIVQNPTPALYTISKSCNGELTTLQADATASSYKWSTGDTTASISVKEPGLYSVVATNATGCESDTFTTVYSGDITTNCIKGQMELEVATKGDDYAWFNKDGGIDDSNSEVITVSETGDYRVEVRQNNELKVCAFTGVYSLNCFDVFPNPSSGLVNLSLNTNFSDVVVSITNVQGKEVWNLEIPKTANFFYKTLDLSGLTAGVYFVNINTAGFEQTKKLVIINGTF